MTPTQTRVGTGVGQRCPGLLSAPVWVGNGVGRFGWLSAFLSPPDRSTQSLSGRQRTLRRRGRIQDVCERISMCADFAVGFDGSVAPVWLVTDVATEAVFRVDAAAR
jgi:hypothetical protein